MILKNSAVIIGAGVGGIATAVYLAKNGYSVNVYEKNSAPGGRCGQLIRDGHRFDLGRAAPRLVPEPVAQPLSQLFFQWLGPVERPARGHLPGRSLL